MSRRIYRTDTGGIKMNEKIKVIIAFAIIVIIFLFIRESGWACGNAFLEFLCKK